MADMTNTVSKSTFEYKGADGKTTDAYGNAVAAYNAASGYNGYNDGGVAIPGRSGPFANYLLPGMGDEARFNAGPVRNSTGWAENQLGRYAVKGIPEGQKRQYAGPIASASVSDQFEGWTQALNTIAALQANTIHEIATLKLNKFWINMIKSEAWKPFNGWESKVTIFRGGLLHQSGLSNWRRILPVPEKSLNHPSTFPGFETVMGTTEELTGIGYETGWGSDAINIDHLRNVPNAPQQIKEILDVGVNQAIALRESYNRETYINMACLMHRAFVMCCDCQPTEDVGSRIFIYDPHVASDLIKGSELPAGTKIVGKPGNDQTVASTDLVAPVDDRAAFTNQKVYAWVDEATRCDIYGQYHAEADCVKDPTTGEARPFILVDAGAAGTAEQIEPPNFDMLERMTDEYAQRCPEAAVGSDGDVPVFSLTINHSDIDKLIRATPIEWDAWRRAEPQALISHYGISKAKIYRRWAIVNDTNQLRMKPIAYISNYTADKAKQYGNVGYRDGDDPGLQGRAVYVCVVINPKMLSPTRKGTNGYSVPVPNPEYFTAPLALANVVIKDTFINQLEGPAPTSIGNGTSFGPTPPCNGSWGFLNIPDKLTNPFRSTGNFYGLLRTHVKPTKYTQEAACFVYARDVQAFKAFTQAENKIINPDYTGETQTALVNGGEVLPPHTDVAKTEVEAGKPIMLELATTPHLTLEQGSVVTLKGTSKSASVVVLDAGRWPKVLVAPTEGLTLADFGLEDKQDVEGGKFMLKLKADSTLSIAGK